ncbi:unnamed protein product [Notodromas monacha]|uniref:Prokineticin domain-containing protein n=1 Tax=Notodromas monacha TaxID=399045 RepID=A0A7R9GIT1_9CRUS|nr:unnamed protein product [Notodromas monacha]CAG0922926.1 unnamed protein product [Notodromas monacha]
MWGCSSARRTGNNVDWGKATVIAACLSTVIFAVSSVVDSAGQRGGMRRRSSSSSSKLLPDDLVDRDLFECRSSADCGFGFCCVVGMDRYSVPTCRRLGKPGDQCIPRNKPRNVTLWYPRYSAKTVSGLELDLTDVYRILCPCDTGRNLSCDRRDGVCADIELTTNNLFSHHRR